jgi:hypothetical protein
MGVIILFKPAERKRAYLKIGIFGPAGSGKTASSLLIAYGITKDWSKIGLVDTENGSGELYAGSTIGGVHIGQYQVARITAPFEPAKYIAAINAAVKGGLEVLILDSISHAWAGEGGLLDLQGKVTSKVGNSYTAWREVTPLHNQFVEAMLQSRIHLIATLRAKQEYILEQNEKGKMAPRKVGLAPIQRDGMEYEFTTVFSLGGDHIATAEKDRTNLFDGKFFAPSPETGELFVSWLTAAPGKPEEPKTPEAPEKPKKPGKKPESKKPEDKTQKGNTFTVAVMEEPKKVEDGYELTVLIVEPAEAAEVRNHQPLKLVSHDLYDQGQAIQVFGTIDGDRIVATAIVPVAGKKEETVRLLADPKVTTFQGHGKLPWAYVAARDEGKYAVVGECIKPFKRGDELKVVVIGEEVKETGTLLFVESAVKAPQEAIN